VQELAEVTNLLRAWSNGDAAALTEEEIAEVLEISARTVRRDWEFARVWLARQLDHSLRVRV
jgi:DNA-directed RNA polymerase specialized sigma24 family protein